MHDSINKRVQKLLLTVKLELNKEERDLNFSICNVKLKQEEGQVKKEARRQLGRSKVKDRSRRLHFKDYLGFL